MFQDEIVGMLPSQFTKVEDLGQSLDNRSIQALCLGACNAEGWVPQTLYTGMHHSREVGSSSVLCSMLLKLLANRCLSLRSFA